MSKFTPGPWHLPLTTIGTESGRVWEVSTEGGRGVWVANVQVRADAELIAAAPEMYEALKAQEALESHREQCYECGASLLCDPAWELEKAATAARRAALSKAEGRE